MPFLNSRLLERSERYYISRPMAYLHPHLSRRLIPRNKILKSKNFSLDRHIFFLVVRIVWVKLERGMSDYLNREIKIHSLRSSSWISCVICSSSSTRSRPPCIIGLSLNLSFRTCIKTLIMYCTRWLMLPSFKMVLNCSKTTVLALGEFSVKKAPSNRLSDVLIRAWKSEGRRAHVRQLDWQGGQRMW